ncbi:HAD family hydrolase [Motilibacter aurantiacus]|uniref:HAD family hydrolase n=1 Tax=Motilibacter aurantiacus TaxID=2714955 RepID=UPI001E64556A|nr:HAD family hydrolase [Motilibacter aurantiacus]
MAGTARGVLLDVDGTLVDTTYLHTVAFWQAFRQFGHDVPMARIHRSVGMGADKLVAHLLGAGRDTGQDEDLQHAHSSLYSTFWQRLRPLPGAVDLLRECKRRGLTVVLASSASADELSALRATLDAEDLIDVATGSADAEGSKPEPDILEAALAKSGLAADQVVFVGDSVWDVEAAARLDIPCIGLECGGTNADELTDRGAVEAYWGPAELLGAFDRSALARLLR